MMPACVKFRFTRATCSTVMPLSISFSKRSDATSNPPETAMQPEALSNKQRSRVKLFSNRTFVHQLTDNFLLMISIARARISAGGAASSTK